MNEGYSQYKTKPNIPEFTAITRQLAWLAIIVILTPPILNTVIQLYTSHHL